MFGSRVRRRVRPRRVSRDGAVVDDAPAARVLRLHQPDGLLRTQERAGQVDGHHLHPLLVAEFFQRDGGRVGAGVVEQNIEAPERLPGLGEQRLDGIRIRHVGRHAENPAAGRRCRGGPLQSYGAPSGKHQLVSRRQQRQGDRTSNTAAGARNERDPAVIRHKTTLTRRDRNVTHRGLLSAIRQLQLGISWCHYGSGSDHRRVCF